MKLRTWSNAFLVGLLLLSTLPAAIVEAKTAAVPKWCLDFDKQLWKDYFSKHSWDEANSMVHDVYTIEFEKAEERNPELEKLMELAEAMERGEKTA